MVAHEVAKGAARGPVHDLREERVEQVVVEDAPGPDASLFQHTLRQGPVVEHGNAEDDAEALDQAARYVIGQAAAGHDDQNRRQRIAGFRRGDAIE